MASVALAGESVGSYFVEADLDEGLQVRVRPDLETLQIEWSSLNGDRPVVVRIDDSSCRRTPVVELSSRSGTLSLDLVTSGLVPGISYELWIEPGSVGGNFRLVAEPSARSRVDGEYLSAAWKTTGRAWLRRYGGVKWNDTAQSYEFDDSWAYSTRTGPQAYYLEYALRGAVERGLVNRDMALLDELASFLLVYRDRFMTLAELRGFATEDCSAGLLVDRGDDAVRTLPWLESRPGAGTNPGRVRECTLCNSQLFHGVSRLIRGISLLAVEERTETMNDFVRWYAPLVVEEHLLRLGFEASFRQYTFGAGDLPDRLIEMWRQIARAEAAPGLTHQHAMFDRDLWLIATAAEILGAHANDPALVPLHAHVRDRLVRLVDAGVAFFRSKRGSARSVLDWAGEPVVAVSYFDGDFDSHPSMAHAGYEGQEFPGERSRPAVGGSWDISHFYRVPLFLRAMYDNRKATGLDFPTASDIEPVVNQYLYGVFHGDLSKPLFRNFFDGGDGWYRVDVERRFGHPPSRYCDMAFGTRQPCLTVGAVFGWSFLSFTDPRLRELQESVIALAMSEDPEAVRHRRRYFQWNRQEYALGTNGSESSMLLLVLLSSRLR